jgi:hypothetical protein
VSVLVQLFQEGVERRQHFCRLMREELAASEDVENLARRLLRAERESWQSWLVKDAREALWSALGRLDVARARLAVLREGT